MFNIYRLRVLYSDKPKENKPYVEEFAISEDDSKDAVQIGQQKLNKLKKPGRTIHSAKLVVENLVAELK